MGPKPVQFQKRTAKLNWQQIAAVDLERVENGGGFDQLQSCLQNVVFGQIDEELLESGPGSTAFVKLFKLSQYMIEYLMHSQEYLQSVVTDLQTRLQSEINKRTQTRKELDSSKRLWKTEMDGFLLRVRSNDDRIIAYQCDLCRKEFVSQRFLDAHKERKHSIKQPLPGMQSESEEYSENSHSKGAGQNEADAKAIEKIQVKALKEPIEEGHRTSSHPHPHVVMPSRLETASTKKGSREERLTPRVREMPSHEDLSEIEDSGSFLRTQPVIGGGSTSKYHDGHDGGTNREISGTDSPSMWDAEDSQRN